MSSWLQVVALLAVASVSSVSAQLCDDPCFCPSGAVMDCANRRLVRPPEGYWPRIQKLDLAGNQISVLYKNSFSGFPNVYPLHLAGNQLAEIDLEALALIQNLQNLYLENNRIERVLPAPPGARMEQLIYVFLNNNSISSLDADVFQPAVNLQYLFLNNNPIVVPQGQPVLNHPTLQLLHMQYGSTLNLGPGSFEGLPNLQEAVLISAGITSITGVFVNNTRLRVAALISNSITAVTAGTFAPNKTLSGLHLDNNPLERLDVAAVDGAMVDGASLAISNTPLACSCGYECLYCWAQQKNIRLYATCDGVDNCSFTKCTE